SRHAQGPVRELRRQARQGPWRSSRHRSCAGGGGGAPPRSGCLPEGRMPAAPQRRARKSTGGARAAEPRHCRPTCRGGRMIESDRKPFFTLLADVHAFYRQNFSEFAGRVWWEAMKPFDFPSISSAFGAHAVNVENGQFMPKPADIVRVLTGTTTDG